MSLYCTTSHRHLLPGQKLAKIPQQKTIVSDPHHQNSQKQIACCHDQQDLGRKVILNEKNRILIFNVSLLIKL